MSFILDDFVCERCEKISESYRDNRPKCCGKYMNRMPGGHNFEWGESRYYPTLREEPFSSRSEKKKWAIDAGLSEMGDKEGGARNEDHRNMGKLYSYKGAHARSKIS